MLGDSAENYLVQFALATQKQGLPVGREMLLPEGF